jgi:hypothetical protein
MHYRGVVIQFLKGAREFSPFSKASRSVLGPTQLTIKWTLFYHWHSADIALGYLLTRSVLTHPEAPLKANLHISCRFHAVSMPCPCRAHAVSMPCSCRAHAVFMPCPCRVHDVPMPCQCRVHAVSMPCQCRAHAIPLPCRAAKGLDCVFPI